MHKHLVCCFSHFELLATVSGLVFQLNGKKLLLHAGNWMMKVAVGLWLPARGHIFCETIAAKKGVPLTGVRVFKRTAAYIACC